MKTILVLLTCVSLARADQGADAFVTGFANGLNQALYRQQHTNNAQQVNVTYQEVPAVQAQPVQQPLAQPYYDAVNDNGTQAGMIFDTKSACWRYVLANTAWKDCVYVR